jgi:hypothetical protein
VRIIQNTAMWITTSIIRVASAVDRMFPKSIRLQIRGHL